MDLANAIGIINSRKLVSDGAHLLKVTNVTDYQGKKIVNFAAMTQYHMERALDAIDNGDVIAAVNSGLSANLRPGTDYIPNKGEIVKVVVDTVTTKNGVTGQFVISVSELATQAPVAIDFAARLAARKPSGEGDGFGKLEADKKEKATA